MIRSLGLKLIAIIMGALAVYLFYLVLLEPVESYTMGNGYIWGMTLLIIGALTVWMFSDVGMYNNWVDTVKMIPNPKGLKMPALFAAFKDMDTDLGRPWLGKVKFVGGKSLIWGPNPEGEYIYAYTGGLTSDIKLSMNMVPGFITPPPGEEWRLDALEEDGEEMDVDDEVLRHRFDAIGLMTDLAERLTVFAQDPDHGDVDPVDTGGTKETYMFEESFRWTGQDFYLFDAQGQRQMKISAPLPCKTFHISRADDETEIFMLTKRIFHILPHYDLYECGTKIGRMKKRLVFHHDHFTADTPYGKLELRSITATISANFKVTLDGRLIGTIARQLTPNLGNLVFENFVLTLHDPKHLVLMTAMGVMTARELRRDQMAALRTLRDDF